MLSKRDYDGARHQVLALLTYGTQDLEKIKEMLFRTRGYQGEGDASVAGRSQVDTIVRKIMSSLCRAGLVKSVRMRQFCITKEGKEVLFNDRDNMITTKDLEKKSFGYRRLTSELDLAETTQWPEEVLVERKAGVVALIDMLGTRVPRNASDTRIMHNNRNKVLSCAKHLVKKELGSQSFEVSAFSDTMFVTAEGDAKALLSAFGRVCSTLIPESIVLDIPIRGCVAAGEFYQSGRRLFTGPAVTEAASYYERPQWIGVSSCPSAYNKIDGLSSGSACYTKYDMPLKSSVEYGAIVVNWPDRYNDEHADREVELDKMIGILDCKLEQGSDIEASLK